MVLKNSFWHKQVCGMLSAHGSTLHRSSLDFLHKPPNYLGKTTIVWEIVCQLINKSPRSNVKLLLSGGVDWGGSCADNSLGAAVSRETKSQHEGGWLADMSAQVHESLNALMSLHRSHCDSKEPEMGLRLKPWEEKM